MSKFVIFTDAFYMPIDDGPWIEGLDEHPELIRTFETREAAEAELLAQGLDPEVYGVIEVVL